MSEKRRLGLPAQMGIGMALGIIVGIILQITGTNAEFIKPLGDLFIRLIRMVVVPLIFATLVAGAASMGDAKKLGSIAVKTIGWFLWTTAAAVFLGLFFANIFKPGLGVELTTKVAETQEIVPPGVVETLLNIVPINPIQAFAEGNFLQIIFFAIFFGFALNALGERGKPLLNLFELTSETMVKLTNTVMKFAPIGVFALIAFTVADNGPDVLLPLIKLVATVFVVAILHITFVYVLPLKLITKTSIKDFVKNISEPLLIAFTTCSSAAALPSNMKAVQKSGASRDVASFAIPLGNTINMDGAAIYLGVAAVFVGQIYGMPLSFNDQLMILLMAVLASIGSVGVPSAALVVMTMVFTSVGLPMEGIALVAGVDRVLDMARTTLNVFGDATASMVVSKFEGELGEPQVSEA